MNGLKLWEMFSSCILYTEFRRLQPISMKANGKQKEQRPQLGTVPSSRR